MRLPATIDLRRAVPRNRGRFHIAALLVLFAALAWITETQHERPLSRAVDTTHALQNGCRLPTPRVPLERDDRRCISLR